MRSAVVDTKKRQAALGLPVQRVRYFGSERAALLALDESTPRPKKIVPMADRIHSKLMYMTQSLPAISPAPLYPWRLPGTPEKGLNDEHMPKVNHREKLENDFAQKVLTMVPGRQA